MKTTSLLTLTQLIERDIQNGFPGIAVNVQHEGNNIFTETFGYAYRYNITGQELTHPELLTKKHLFDIASITKIFATTYALMYLYEKNQLHPDNLITDFIPEFSLQNTDYTPTIRDLLTHSSGLPPVLNFYHNQEVGELFSQAREKTIKFLLTKMSLQFKPHEHSVYSDLGMKILGCVIERITNQQLDVFLNETIYKPLRLKHTTFNPLQNGFQPENTVATQIDGHTNAGLEKFLNIRETCLRGEVHDEKSLYSMGGVAGHAGLFSNIEDAGILASLLYTKHDYFSLETLQYFLQPNNVDSSFYLGFWRASSRENRVFFGEKCSNLAFGHTGFTGMCLLSDPEYKLTIMLMSNSVHSPIHYPRVFLGKTYPSGRYHQLIDAIYTDLKLD